MIYQIIVLLLFFFFLRTLFREVLGTQKNEEEETEISQISLPSHLHSLSIINIPKQGGTYVTTDGPPLTHNHQSS